MNRLQENGVPKIDIVICKDVSRRRTRPVKVSLNREMGMKMHVTV